MWKLFGVFNIDMFNGIVVVDVIVYNGLNITNFRPCNDIHTVINLHKRMQDIDIHISADLACKGIFRTITTCMSSLSVTCYIVFMDHGWVEEIFSSKLFGRMSPSGQNIENEGSNNRSLYDQF